MFAKRASSHFVQESRNKPIPSARSGQALSRVEGLRYVFRQGKNHPQSAPVSSCRRQERGRIEPATRQDSRDTCGSPGGLRLPPDAISFRYKNKPPVKPGAKFATRKADKYLSTWLETGLAPQFIAGFPDLIQSRFSRSGLRCLRTRYVWTPPSAHAPAHS